jgi:glycosyltransferase involved in cell wall biosynthesis
VAEPNVSVCVPSYNYARFLPDCIESVLQQTHRDFELIVVDDASTDETEALVRRYASLDPRVRYERNPERLGMNGNLKHSADLASGRYIKMLCADDWLTPDCLETFRDLMEANPSAVLAASACIVTNEDGTPTEINFLYDEETSILPGAAMLAQIAAGEGVGGNSSFFIRRAAYHAVGGFDASLLYAADLDLGAKLCRIGDYLHTNRPLFYGREQRSSSSSINPRKLYDVQDQFTILRRLFGDAPFPKADWFRFQAAISRLTANYLFTVATTGLRGDVDYARRLFDLLRERGNWPLGLPAMAYYVPRRIVRRLRGTHRPVSRPPEPGMGPPTRQIGPVS